MSKKDKPKYDIDTLQKEVFEYLKQKHKEENKAGSEFYFNMPDLKPKNFSYFEKGWHLFVYQKKNTSSSY